MIEGSDVKIQQNYLDVLDELPNGIFCLQSSKYYILPQTQPAIYAEVMHLLAQFEKQDNRLGA